MHDAPNGGPSRPRQRAAVARHGMARWELPLDTSRSFSPAERTIMSRPANLPFELLQTFLLLVESRGNAKAATEQLRIKQPSMSKRLSRLQFPGKTLEHPWIFRDGKTWLPTAEGKRVLLLEDVIVSATYRGRGLGRHLVEQVCVWAAAEGMTRVTLLADRDNRPALDFYERLGFEASAMVVRRLRLPGF